MAEVDKLVVTKITGPALLAAAQAGPTTFESYIKARAESVPGRAYVEPNCLRYRNDVFNTMLYLLTKLGSDETGRAVREAGFNDGAIYKLVGAADEARTFAALAGARFAIRDTKEEVVLEGLTDLAPCKSCVIFSGEAPIEGVVVTGPRGGKHVIDLPWAFLRYPGGVFAQGKHCRIPGISSVFPSAYMTSRRVVDYGIREQDLPGWAYATDHMGIVTCSVANLRRALVTAGNIPSSTVLDKFVAGIAESLEEVFAKLTPFPKNREKVLADIIGDTNVTGRIVGPTVRYNELDTLEANTAYPESKRKVGLAGKKAEWESIAKGARESLTVAEAQLKRMREVNEKTLKDAIERALSEKLVDEVVIDGKFTYFLVKELHTLVTAEMLKATGERDYYKPGIYKVPPFIFAVAHGAYGCQVRVATPEFGTHPQRHCVHGGAFGTPCLDHGSSSKMLSNANLATILWGTDPYLFIKWMREFMAMPNHEQGYDGIWKCSEWVGPVPTPTDAVVPPTPPRKVIKSVTVLRAPDGAHV